MVFLQLSSFGGDQDGLPSGSGYGFDFADDWKPNKDNFDTDHVRLEDEEIFLPKNGRKLTHRFMFAKYGGCKGCIVFEGETFFYQSDKEDKEKKSKQVVGKISAILFNTHEMNESLQMAGDCITEEVYDAMCTLFNGNGTPKGAFKKKLQDYSVGAGILYIGGVYVHKNYRGQGLGIEIVRSLIGTMVHGDYDEHCPNLVLLCPAAEPHPGPAAWPYAFDALSKLFEKGLQFQRCAATNRRNGQSKYMFLEPFENFDILETPPPPPPAAAAAVAAAVSSVKSKTSPSSVAVTIPTLVNKNNKVVVAGDNAPSGEKPMVKTNDEAAASKEGLESVASVPKRQKTE